MSDTLLVYITILIALAITTQDSFVMIIVYILGGALLLGRWWNDQTMKKLEVKRKYPERIFLGEAIQLKLEIKNQIRLPIVWMRVQDSLPVDLSAGPFFQQVLSMNPRESLSLSYPLTGRKRGYYAIGPLQISSGDLLGLNRERVFDGVVNNIIVYPRVIPLPKLALPSHSPLGSTRHHLPIYEDPSRPAGKRDYKSGDSLRRIDWKASAAEGRLQVKLFEPTVEVETALFLNLNSEEYHYRTRFDATELAIVVAASIANCSSSHKQSVGLFTNGNDPLGSEGKSQPILPRKGRGHLIRILETLARIKIRETTPIATLIQQQRVNLSWGTTIVVITGGVDQGLFDEFFRTQRAGMDIVLILCGNVANLQSIRQQCHHFNIQLYSFMKEDDLEIWRK